MIEINIFGVNEYMTDSRGDVGSWIRLQSILNLSLFYISSLSLYLVLLLPPHNTSTPTTPTTPITTIQSSISESDSILDSYEYDFDSDSDSDFDSSLLSSLLSPSYSSSFILSFSKKIQKLLLFKINNNNENEIDNNKNNKEEIERDNKKRERELIEILIKEYGVRVICVLLKESFDKLDKLRDFSARSLFSLLLLFHSLSSSSSSFGFDFSIPHLSKLVSIFPKNEKDIVWSSTNETFPFILKSLSLPEYSLSALSGLLVTIGSLTKPLSNDCKTSLENCYDSITMEEIFCPGILSIFIFYHYPLSSISSSSSRLHQKTIESFFSLGRFSVRPKSPYESDRVIVPLLKSVHYLLTKREFYFPTASDEFYETLLERVKDEARGCTDIPKLTSIVDILNELVSVESTRVHSLQILLIQILNRYPKVRVYTSEQLKSTLEKHSSIIFIPSEKHLLSPNERLSQSLNLLANNQWDSDKIDFLRSERDKMFSLFDISKFQPITQK